MGAQNVYDHDGGIGFDMRNARLFNDSDDEDENVEQRHRPRPYDQNKESGFGCCYILIIAIILVIGSVIGYSLGSTFNAVPKQFEAATDPPAQSKVNENNTPSPTHRDPFHNHRGGRNKKGIQGIFAPQTTPPPTQNIVIQQI